MSDVLDALVIGAGQAGLAAGYHLQRRGLRFALLEAREQPSGSWPSYYDSLKLFSPARYSALPGLPFPGDPDRYPQRDEVVAYLEHYARHFGLPVVSSSPVTQVECQGDRFHVTAGTRVYTARNLIAATGAFHRPYIPDLPGQQDFQGQILHAAAYRSPEPFRGQRVIVVGSRNSAVQIAVELAKVAQVTLAVRHPIKFSAQRLWGRDVHFWGRLSGFDWLPLGYWRRVGESNGVLDTGLYQAALTAGRPDQRPMFTVFQPNGVIWPDGSAEQVDAVICATGYRPNVDFLAGLGALDEHGHPLQRGGISSTVPGLYYVGLMGQRSHASATLRGVGADAQHVVRHMLRHRSSY